MLCKLLIHIYSHLKQLHILCNKMIHFGYKGGCGVHGIAHVLMCIKEELAWATDNRPWVISSNIILRTTKEL